MLKKIWKLIDGHKTHLGAISYGVLGILWSEGVCTDEQARLIGLLITAWTGYSVRDAIKKGGKARTCEGENARR